MTRKTKAVDFPSFFVGGVLGVLGALLIFLVGFFWWPQLPKSPDAVVFGRQNNCLFVPGEKGKNGGGDGGVGIFCGMLGYAIFPGKAGAGR